MTVILEIVTTSKKFFTFILGYNFMPEEFKEKMEGN